MVAKGETLAKQPHGPPENEMLAGAERRLAKQVQAGDSAAFDALVRQHWAKIASVNGRFLNDANDVEDATQETFIRAFQHMHSFRGESGLRTWLIRIAVNICKNRRNGFWFRRVQLAPGDADVLANVADAQASALLMMATNLPDSDRLILLAPLHPYRPGQALPHQLDVKLTVAPCATGYRSGPDNAILGQQIVLASAKLEWALPLPNMIQPINLDPYLPAHWRDVWRKWQTPAPNIEQMVQEARVHWRENSKR